MPDLEVSKLPAMAGTALQATDPLPLADLSASETKRITVKDLIQHGVALIDDGSIPSTKFNFTLPAGSVGTTQLAPGAVTATRLADNSSAAVNPTLPATGQFIGQLGFSSTTGKLSIWDGGTWQAFKAAGSINAITPDTSGLVQVAAVQSGDTVALNAELTATPSAAQFLAGPTAAGGAVAARVITGPDLPVASTTARGAVLVNGDGLRMNADRLVVDNTVAANATAGHLVRYTANGLVTAGAPITSVDLPIATAIAVGAVRPDSDLTVDGVGTLRHTNAVTAGTGTKVTFDANGHITSVAPLLAADVPELDSSKITTGSFSGDRLLDRTVTQQKLADYATAYIQESVPPAGVGAHPIGMIWLQESTGQVSVWNGNSWMKTGASTLFNRNLRYGGTYNAATGVVTGVTQFGTAEGFKVGDTIPAADDKIAGLYFVASAGGASSSLASGAVMDAGDWLLCQGTTGGWVRIDTLSGGGGGGGSTVSNLDDLLDVTLTSPTSGDFLQLNTSGQWVHVSVLDEGTWA